MTQIEIIKKHEPAYEGVWDYVVELGPEGDHLGYLVHLEPGYWEDLTEGKTSPEQLIKKTFDFLLTKQTAISLEAEFSCREVAQWYPEYEEAMRKKKKRLWFLPA